MLRGSSALGKSDTVELAMSFDADEDVKEREGHTPLLLAMDKGHRTAAEALVNAGASIIVL